MKGKGSIPDLLVDSQTFIEQEYTNRRTKRADWSEAKKAVARRVYAR